MTETTMTADDKGPARELVARRLSDINSAWLRGKPEELAPLFHEDILLVFPGFAGRAEGKTAAIVSFEDFCVQARVLRFDEADRQIDVRGSVAVASYVFDVLYERGGEVYRSRGRDLWVFSREEGQWLAVWRTQIDVTEERVESHS